MIILRDSATLVAKASVADTLTLSAYGIEVSLLDGTQSYVRLFNRVLPTSNDVCYTTPPNHYTLVVEIICANPTVSAATLLLWHVAAAGSVEAKNVLLPSLNILASTVLIWNKGRLGMRPEVSPGTSNSSDGQVIYNESGALTGDAGMTYDAASDKLTVGALVLNGITITVPPKSIFDHYADVGNSGTSATDLYSDTLAANLFSANGVKLIAHYSGSFVSSATATRRLLLYLAGAPIFDTGALTLSLSAAWVLNFFVIRKDATNLFFDVSLTTEGAALAAYTASGTLSGLTLSSTMVLKIVGVAAGVGAASNDIVAHLGYGQLIPAVA